MVHENFEKIDKNLEKHPLPPGPKLNLGCGPIQPTGWVNIDGSHRAWLAAKCSLIDRLLTKLRILPKTEFGPHITVLNLLKPLPYSNNSISCIYAGELIEHFELQDAEKLITECYRVLKPRGVLRICVPDGAVFWRRYLEIFDDIMNKPKNERNADPLRKHVGMYFREIFTKRKIFSSMGHTHKWQYDEPQLIELVESKGFQYVQRMRFHESRIPEIEKAERSDFLIVEGLK